MRTPFRDLSLRHKLGWMNFSVLLLGGLLISLLLGAHSWLTQREDLLRHSETVARVLAQNAVPAILFEDARGANEVLNALDRYPEVMLAQLTTTDGRLFARYQRPALAERSTLSRIERALPFAEYSLLVKVSAESQSQPVASLELTIDLWPTYGRVYAAMAAIVLLVIAVCIALLLLQSRIVARMLEPVGRLLVGMQRVSETADYQQRVEVESRDEIGQITQSFNDMMGLIEERDQAMEHLALYDTLTGLNNRHYMRMRARLPALAPGESCALLYLDVDNFKNINDNLDHNFGDRVLAALAGRLVSAAPPDTLLVRFGGDEFVVCLQHVLDASQAQSMAQQLSAAINAPMTIQGRELSISVSVGIALAPQHGNSYDELLQKADAAMHVAKNNGRDEIQMWHSGISQQANDRFLLEADLRTALANDQLSVAYQPIIDLRDGRVIGMEALARWLHPQRGWISPTEFVPIAEDSGLIVSIGAWILEQACRQARQWHAQFGPLFLAVNVSGRQFRDPDLVAKVQAICQLTHMPFDLLHLEVTESTLMQDTMSASKVMQGLVALGIKLSLDDFGTGYSSLAYLKRFPLQKLKIDKSFIHELPRNPDDGAIVKAIVSLGRALNMQVLAEGIETESHERVLVAMGCDQGQGFYYSKPIWARDFEQFVFSRHQSLKSLRNDTSEPR
jgi:diguanylate cyclase (GGDEF)-like protein